MLFYDSVEPSATSDFGAELQPAGPRITKGIAPGRRNREEERSQQLQQQFSEKELPKQSEQKHVQRQTRKNPQPRKRVPQGRCPIRFGEPCTACQPGTYGPEDCQLVQLVMEDDDLRARMQEMNQRLRKIRNRK